MSALADNYNLCKLISVGIVCVLLMVFPDESVHS